MTEQEAIQLALDYLREQISITVRNSELAAISTYGFDAATEYLMEFGLYEQAHVGASNYLAVSKTSGVVRYLGRFGE